MPMHHAQPRCEIQLRSVSSLGLGTRKKRQLKKKKNKKAPILEFVDAREISYAGFLKSRVGETRKSSRPRFLSAGFGCPGTAGVATATRALRPTASALRQRSSNTVRSL